MSPRRPTSMIDTPSSPWDRLFETFRGPGFRRGDPDELPDFSSMTDDEKRAYITRLAPVERTIALAAAVLAVVLALGFYLPRMIGKPKIIDPTVKPSHHACPPGIHPRFFYTHVTGKAVCETIYPASHWVLDLVLPVVLAAGIVVTVRLRKRSAVAFTTVLAGLSIGDVITLLPFAVAGGWIMLRAWRTQKYGAPNKKVLQPGWAPPAPRASSRRPKSAAGSGSGTTRSAKTGTATNRKAPTANKRYTPRTPPKPVKK